MDPSLADESLAEELQCAICWDVLSHPSSLPCGHSFCLQPCLSALHQNGKIRCPTCRKQARIDPSNMAENKQLAHICDRIQSAKQHACPHHKGKTLSYYCHTCDKRCCDVCAILGLHRGHEIDSLDEAGTKTAGALASQEQRVAAVCTFAQEESVRVASAFHSLATHVDETADQAIDAIETLRVRTKLTLSSHKACDQGVHSKQVASCNALATSIRLKAMALPHMDGQHGMLSGVETDAIRTGPHETERADTMSRKQAAAASAMLHDLPSFKELVHVQKALAQGSAFDPSMQVFLQCPRILGGALPKTMCVKASWTLSDVTDTLCVLSGIKHSNVLCVYRQGKPLCGTSTLGEQGVHKGCTLDVRFRHNGGGGGGVVGREISDWG